MAYYDQRESYIQNTPSKFIELMRSIKCVDFLLISHLVDVGVSFNSFFEF